MIWRKSSHSCDSACVEVAWRKSSRSQANGCCVEVGYRKSSQSAQNGCCVEAHQHAGEIHVRDSKNPDGPYLTFTRAEWRAFVAGAKDGEFDLEVP